MPKFESFFRSDAFKLLIFLAGVMIMGAALAPWIYWGGKHAVAQEWLKGGVLDSLHGSLDRAKFSRYFNRAILISVLVLVWPTLRWMRKNRVKRVSVVEALGLRYDSRRWLHLLVGFVLAALSLFLLATVYLSKGWYGPIENPEALWGVILGALATAAVVATLEEFFFRGILYAVLGKVLSGRQVFWVVAIFFAVIHFFNAPGGLETGEVNAFSGFWVVGQIFGHFFSQFANPAFLLAEFAVLLAIGLVLGMAREKTGALWLSIGLHAGWVFGVKTLSPLIHRVIAPDAMMPWVGENFRMGAFSAILVGLTGVIVWRWLLKGERGGPTGEAAADSVRE